MTSRFAAELSWIGGTRGTPNTSERLQLQDSANTFMAFYAPTQIGSITWTGSQVSYNTSSDYRLKENVVTMSGALARVLQVPVYEYNFSGNPKIFQGFIAHELAPYIPQAVHGQKDAVDSSGNYILQQVCHNQTVPTITGAVKELYERVKALEMTISGLP